jgi:hypothetical protein
MLIVGNGRARPSPNRQERPREHQTPRHPRRREVDVPAFVQQLDELIQIKRITIGGRNTGIVYFYYLNEHEEEPFRV